MSMIGLPAWAQQQIGAAKNAQMGFQGYQQPNGTYAATQYNPALQGAGGGGAGGGGYNAGFNPQVANTYANALTQQFNQARTANQQQLGQMQGLANQFGQGQLDASHQLTQQQVAEGNQQMAQRGLGNSTITQAVQQSAQNQGALRDNQINDQMTQLKLGVLGQNQIQYPNMGAYASLMSQPGAFSGNSGVSTLLGAMTKMNYGAPGSTPGVAPKK